jgi:LPS-assembly protein
LANATFKLDANWVLLGSLRYDLTASKVQSTQIGLGYVDDCFILALNYITSYSYNGNTIADNAIMLQFVRPYGVEQLERIGQMNKPPAAQLGV